MTTEDTTDHQRLITPTTINVLMVIDSRGTYRELHPDFPFSLDMLVKLLRKGDADARFTIKRAHRGTDKYADGADVKGFSFDAHDLAGYDELWLFGVGRKPENPLRESEIEKISDFMQQGGGVFATGDHEDMGWAMCGQLPRVRGMRKWNWPQETEEIDPDDPFAPPEKTPQRHDTVQRHYGDGRFTLTDQSDDIPQIISPHYYPFDGNSKVHPLLSHGRGVITHFPDHPHEGDCYVPENLGRTFWIDGREYDEYPATHPPRTVPEVVAWSTSGSRPAERDDKGILDATTFGAVCAYDGQLQDVGRVVVDATWHHFFGINLTGFAKSTTETGKRAYEEIKQYFMNIGLWLLPKKTVSQVWRRASFGVRWHHQVGMGLRTEFYDNPDGLSLALLRSIGQSALTARPDGFFRLWAGREGIGGHFPQLWQIWGDKLDPWLPSNDTQPSPLPVDLVVEVLLGAIVYGIAATHRELTDDAIARAIDTDWPREADPFLNRALTVLSERATNTAGRLGEFTGSLMSARNPG